ncbi:MAG TPA: hypothetical protein VN767_27915 [Streptosporangiaceae bacterium]|nr:hypothetical protein [Streptosporangiaceae bacterium]
MNAARRYLAVGLLAIAVALWAGLPLIHTGRLGHIAFDLAIGCAVLGVARLIAEAAAPNLPSRADQLYLPVTSRIWLRGLSTLVAVPWPQALIVLAVGLEALHSRRPWHTAVLGVVLICYLITLHLTESNSRLTVFRPQLPLLVTGAALTALSVGAAALPAGPAGSGSGWLAVLAAIAAVVAAALALPI